MAPRQPPDSSLPLDAVLSEWAELIARPDAALDLVEAALVVARPFAPQLDVDRWIGRVDALAAGVAGGLEDGKGSPLDTLLAATTHLFLESGFAGDREDYYDERNSYLHEVLERRLGIPITLSVLLIGVGERLGLDVYGIGFPGHFLVGARVPETTVIDPFRGGRLLDTSDCVRLLEQVTAGSLQFDPGMLSPTPKRQILARILRNLKAIHARSNELGSALVDSERIAMLLPDDIVERRDRGLLRLANGRLRGAVDDLAAYLRALPDAGDAERLTRHLQQAKKKLYSLN